MVAPRARRELIDRARLHMKVMRELQMSLAVNGAPKVGRMLLVNVCVLRLKSLRGLKICSAKVVLRVRRVLLVDRSELHSYVLGGLETCTIEVTPRVRRVWLINRCGLASKVGGLKICLVKVAPRVIPVLLMD